MDVCTPADAARFKIVSTARFNVISDWTDGLSRDMGHEDVCICATGSGCFNGDFLLFDDPKNDKLHRLITKIEDGFDDTLRTISIVDTDYANMSISLNAKLAANGCSILQNALHPQLLLVTGKAMQSIIKSLRKRYDRIADEFEGRTSSLRIVCTYLIYIFKSLSLNACFHLD